MRIEDVRKRLRDCGAKPEHERLMLRAWSRGLPLLSGRHNPDDYFPSGIRNALQSLSSELEKLASVRLEQRGTDHSARLLLELADGQTAECVLLPRDGVCVSTQVGCAVGCAFCMTGQSGLVRQLGSAEIVAQTALARRLQPLRKVVFMGMGEPSHNLSNVLEAIELLGTEGGLAHKQLVFSTVGDHRVFDRLPLGKVKPALALSLHSTKAELRAKLLPRAARIDPSELVERAEAYARATTYPVQYQWTLLEGVNDGEDEVENLILLLAGKRAVLNFIPYNEVPGVEFKRPSWDRIVKMVRTLHSRGVLTKLRRSAGQEIEGACGQLRARAKISAEDKSPS